MLKHYYRLVYWKRRIGRTLGWRRRSGTGPRTGTKPGDRGPGRRDGRLRRTMERVRPLLVFVVLVLIVVLASALLGWRDDTFGAGHREGGVTVRPSGGGGTGVVTVSCGPRDGACAVRGGATERAVAGVG
ncbi:hypothetical protein ACH4VR_20125 [Streptomyces sp. NPDC020883]|uniref:hypothetical protein n=1 Tax=Streptomyces sp. NPDC020883 TaxID=3365099 RepID=UPI0037A533A0